MYRNPMRRGFSPDSPHRYSPHSREDSWTRGRSPPSSRQHRSPDRRSPGRHGRSRPGARPRSRSRGRPARSRSRPRRSPSPYSQYRRRSPGDTYRYEGRSNSDQHRLSPSYRSNPSGDLRPQSSPHDSSSGIKSFGQSSGDTAPLPMPKKSILKKRTDVEPTGHDQSPQVDTFSSNNDVRSSSTTGKNAEKSSLNVERQQLSPPRIPGPMALHTSSTSSSSLPAASEKTESPTSWTLSSSSEMKGNVMGINPEQTDCPRGAQYSSVENPLFSNNAPISQTVPFSGMNIFSEGIQKRTDRAGAFLLPHEQDSKSSPLPSKHLSPKQRSSIEIEDEERFLYGEEEEKKPEPQKTPTSQTAPAPPPAADSSNKQEFEKIHDLLKTIGLDIGVAEIGKLAVRTQERLHGKKLAPKMSQAGAEPPQSTVTASPTDVKAKIPEPQVKTEKKDGAETPMKTEQPMKPASKEPVPPVTQPSPNPATKEKPQLILRKSSKETPSVAKIDIPVQQPSPSTVPSPTPTPINPVQMPVYPPYQHSPMVTGYNIPPPNYNPYAPYVSYATPSWAMYSPMPSQPGPMPTPTVPPPISVPVSTPPPVFNPRSNLRVIETTADILDAKTAVKTDTKPTTPLALLLAKQEADRKNKETEKKKVLEELDTVRKEHKVKSDSLKTLSAKVEQLRVQQGILLRKKRREKDGHKDPLLEELNNVMESAQKQINSLREEISTTKQKQQQLTKVAEILGVSPSELAEKSEPKKERKPASPAPTRDSDNESRTSSDFSKSANDLKTSSSLVSKTDAKAKSSSKSGADTKSMGAAHPSKVAEKSEDSKSKGTPPISCPDRKKSPEPRSPNLSKSEDILKSRDKSRSKSPRPCASSSKTSPKSEEPSPFVISEVFDYYDPGSHWCEDCNAICMTLPEYLLHLHDKKHDQYVKEKKPWVKKKVQELGNTKKQRVNIPLKGPEFMIPVNGYYCELCDEMLPDHIAAEDHLRAYAHNDKYKKHIDLHVNYEMLRREKKKTSLTVAQEAAREAARKLADQKRKLPEQKHDGHEHSKSKKAKKEEQEEERKAKHRTSASPPPPEKLNKTPEKEPVKNPSFGKFFWKPAENKAPVSQTTVPTSKLDTTQNKPKEEESKAFSLKPKGFAIKLLGKPSTLPGNALSMSNSSSVTTTAPTACSSSAAPTSFPAPISSTVSPVSTAPATTTAAQTKVQPNLPGFMSIRPNLPSVTNPRPATPLVNVSKPAPLNTFLSIKSPNAISKAIPIVKNSPTGIFSEDLVSKAFGGEVVILKEKVDSKAKIENKEQENKSGQSTKPLQQTKGQDLFNVLINKNETAKKQEVKNGKESIVSKPPLHSISQKSEPVPPASSSQTTNSGPTIPTQSPASATVQQTPNTKPAITNSTSSPVSSTSAKSSTNTIKYDGFFRPINQPATKAGSTPRRESRFQQPQVAKTPSNSQKETPKGVKTSTFSMNPTTGRFEYLPVQQTNVKTTNVPKLPEAKPTPSAVTPVKPSDVRSNDVRPNVGPGDVKPNDVRPGDVKPSDVRPGDVKPSDVRPGDVKPNDVRPGDVKPNDVRPGDVKPNDLKATTAAVVTKPTINTTTRLNQKFKKDPLSLPSSLFGHVDPGCRDIKITSIESQKTNSKTSENPLLKAAQKQVSSSLPAKTSNLQNELDTYYKQIATEEDPEDLTTSEDQDSEAAATPMDVIGAPNQRKAESPPDKKIKLESELPPVKTTITPALPDVSSEDVDDSDMACEVPDVSSSSASQMFKSMQTNYASSQSFWSSKWQPSGLVSGDTSMNKSQSKETQGTSMTTAPAAEASMEDLSVFFSI